jgi:hypothetical protein
MDVTTARVVDPYEPAFYEAIGRFVVAFAMFELTANAVGTIVYNCYGGRTIVARLPKTISLVVEYLRMASDLDDIRPFSDDLRSMLALTDDLLRARRFIVHGMHGLNDAEEPVLGKSLITRDNMYMERMPATTETILIHRATALKLGNRMAGFAVRLSDHKGAGSV